MIKSDLRTGDIVTLREGGEYVVLLDIVTQYMPTPTVDIILRSRPCSQWVMLDHYNTDLTHKVFDELDIIKIEQLSHPADIYDVNFGRDKRTLLWEEPHKTKMTLKEIEERLGFPIEIVEE